ASFQTTSGARFVDFVDSFLSDLTFYFFAGFETKSSARETDRIMARRIKTLGIFTAGGLATYGVMETIRTNDWTSSSWPQTSALFAVLPGFRWSKSDSPLDVLAKPPVTSVLSNPEFATAAREAA